MTTKSTLFHFTALKSSVALAAFSVFATQSASAIELTDYTQPVSDYERAYVSGQMSANGGNQDQTSFDIQGNGNYEKIYSSLERTNSFVVDGNIDSSRSGAAGAETLTGYDIFGTAQSSNYFASAPDNYWFGAADVGFRRLQGTSDNDDPFVKLSGGVGIGRVINATPLALVIRVVEEFREYGVLQSEPSDAIYLT